MNCQLSSALRLRGDHRTVVRPGFQVSRVSIRLGNVSILLPSGNHLRFLLMLSVCTGIFIVPVVCVKVVRELALTKKKSTHSPLNTMCMQELLCGGHRVWTNAF